MAKYTAMEKDGVVPEIIDAVPEHKIEIRYPDEFEVNMGNELTPFQVKDEPSVKWPAQEGKYYTLLMVDPDAPGRAKPLFGPVKHWLVVNIPGSDLGKGESLAGYIGAGPPPTTGFHRYVFLVYEQSDLLKHSEKAVDSNNHGGRPRWNYKKFVQKYNLGQPIAANYFKAQTDQYSKDKWAKISSGSFSGRMQNMLLNIYLRIYYGSSTK